MTLPTLLLSTWLARWRQRWRARQVLRACGGGLPAWALSEVSFSPPQATWLHRSLCLWHLRAGADRPQHGHGPVPLAQVTDRLARLGVALQACRLADVRALRRGDVLVLSDAAARRLFGEAAIGGGGLALVVEAGAQAVRLSPALSPRALNCSVDKLHGALAGWVLRSRAVEAPAGRGAWAMSAA
jgi:hypothetical protein